MGASSGKSLIPRASEKSQSQMPHESLNTAFTSRSQVAAFLNCIPKLAGVEDVSRAVWLEAGLHPGIP